MLSNNFAGRLKELREAAGMTQPQLAEKAGMSKGGIADLEQGRREPAWATVLALCTALNVSCEEFRQEPAATSPQGRGRPASKVPGIAKETKPGKRKK